MALRDIFDMDPHSKEQLRAKLQDREATLTVLSAQRDQLHTAVADEQSLNAERLAALDAANCQFLEVTTRANELAYECDELKETVKSSEYELNGLRQLVQTLQATSWTPKEVENLQKREALVIRNFAELQRRENQLAQHISSGINQQISSEHKALRDRVKAAEAEATSASNNMRHLETELETVRQALHAFAVVGSANEPEKDSASHSSNQISDLQAKLDAAVIEIANLQRGTGTEVWNLKNELKMCKDEITWKSSEIRALQAAVEARNPKVEKLQQDLINCQRELAEWKKIGTKRRGEIQKLMQQLELAVQQVTDLEEQIRHFTSIDLSIFRSESVLAWMFSATTPKRLKVEHGHLHLMGGGPWDVDVFGRLMEERGFELWALPDAEVEHIVVGRNSWNRDDLLQHIDARQGLGLRIYSQEMWFAAMSTGRDPFDADDQVLLNAFADGHEALEYLRQPGFDWPNLSIKATVGVTKVPPGELDVIESPMYRMDYRVGRTSPHSPQDRQRILDEIFDAKCLTFHQDCSAAYRKNWGSPRSAQRLYRMAVHIKYLIDGPNGKDWRKPQARVDWVSDLAWLKITYFKHVSPWFVWPG